jgi:eukaryotic-like serine/threonine-protein kinase
MLQVGDVLKDKYRIEREIARGGMGAVYLATHRVLGSSVAIKEILDSQANDPGSKQGFLYEAELLRDLNSPNLPRVRDIFEEKNLLYVVMDYIEGKDLFQLLADRRKTDGTVDPIPLADVLRWADTLLETLETLHGLLTPVIHRDIKPSNLKIGPNGTLYLLDFGLAKVGQTYLKGGTLGFSSPEQQSYQTTDARSDLYSVGATFYSLLAGLYQLVPALDRKIALAAGNPDPIQPLDRLNPNVPRAVCKVFEKAMALDPAERPASAKEMREMLKTAVLPNEVPTIPKPEDKKMAELKLVNNAQDGKSEPHVDPVEVYEVLNKLLHGQLVYLTTLLGVPPEQVPGSSASANAFATVLWNWANGPGGCGVPKLKQEIDKLIRPR